MNKTLEQKALDYHKGNKPGKIQVNSTKSLKTKEEFGLAYTPGVAFPCLEIEKDSQKAFELTAKGNFLAVISNGTAVLGLGDIGALASKPVMEGKAVLFKYLAGIDAIDLEIDEKDPAKLSEYIKALSQTFGGINLEDVSAPACFEIDSTLKTTLGIPFFHDDQTGTAIVTTAATLNALTLVNKDISKIKIIVSGAGAAGISCAQMLCDFGADISNIYLFDSKGLITHRRETNSQKQKYAQEKDQTLEEALDGADLFLGLSKGNLLTKDLVKKMAKDPIIFAMANPTPEILPTHALEARSDCIVGSGRPDFPNQINNVLCFPFLFRGAMDVQAKYITHNMQQECCKAIAKTISPSKDQVLPDPFNPTLIYIVSKAVALAAINDGVATKEMPEDYNNYLDQLLYSSTIEAEFIPVCKSVEAKALESILKIHNIKETSSKELIVSNTNEILKNSLTNATLVFEHFEINANKVDSIKNFIEKSSSQFIGAISEKELFFNNENRIWMANKLCKKTI